MLGYSVLAVFVFANLGAGKLEAIWADCINASEDVDQMLDGYNYDISLAGLVNHPVDGFEQSGSLRLLGVPVPFLKVNLGGNSGIFGPLDTLSRSSEAYSCHADLTTNLTAGLTFKTILTVTYDSVKIKFLFWEVPGKLTYKLKPSIVASFTNIGYLGTDCSMQSFGWKDAGTSYYDVTVDTSTWPGRFVSSVLQRSQQDRTPLLEKLQQTTQNVIGYYLNHYWCLRFGQN